MKAYYFVAFLFVIVSCQSGGEIDSADLGHQCERGNAEACFRLSKTISIADQAPVNKDSDEYAKHLLNKQVKHGLLEKACALWHSAGCVAWGDSLSAAAKKITSESKRREKYSSVLNAYMKPCRTGYAVGCLKVAELFNSGKTPTHWTKRGSDPKRAGQYYKKACMLGATEACNKKE